MYSQCTSKLAIKFQSEKQKTLDQMFQLIETTLVT